MKFPIWNLSAPRQWENNYNRGRITMTILINPYTSISPYLYSFWFHDPLVSNHLKITVQFIIGLCFRHIISADGAARIAIKIWILHNNNYNAIPILKKKNILEKENWHKVKKSLKVLKALWKTNETKWHDLRMLIQQLASKNTSRKPSPPLFSLNLILKPL